MIGIIDYGMGNVGSIFNMLKVLGIESKICSDTQMLMDCDKIILPGVGSFDNAINNLQSRGFIDVIIKKVEKGDLFLGICLGMQLLGSASDEGKLKGLNIIPGKILKFPTDQKFKVPHMGWNTVSYKNNSLSDNFEGNRYYFVHNYYFLPNDSSHVLGQTNYIIDFVSCIKKDNVFGVQFHPEKSHKYGMNLFKKFANY